jgi:uncharacterized Zn-binding protein involved in type VI secretion
MPNAAKVGESLAGGTITGPGCSTVFVEGLPLSVVGDTVAPHGIAPHNSSAIVTGSTLVLAEGLPVVRVGDLASCGHTVSIGAATVEVG